MFRIFMILLFICIPDLLLADNVRIVESRAFDDGSLGETGSGTYYIDTRQDDCAEEGEEDLEKFHDSILRISVVNNLNRAVQFVKFRYRMTVRDEFGSKVRVSVKRLGILSGREALGGGERSEVIVPLFDKIEREKGFPNSSRIFAVDSGFRRVRYTLIGKTDEGKTVRVRSQLMLSIDNYDLCP